MPGMIPPLEYFMPTPSNAKLEKLSKRKPQRHEKYGWGVIGESKVE